MLGWIFGKKDTNGVNAPRKEGADRQEQLRATAKTADDFAEVALPAGLEMPGREAGENVQILLSKVTQLDGDLTKYDLERKQLEQEKKRLLQAYIKSGKTDVVAMIRLKANEKGLQNNSNNIVALGESLIDALNALNALQGPVSGGTDVDWENIQREIVERQVARDNRLQGEDVCGAGTQALPTPTLSEELLQDIADEEVLMQGAKSAQRSHFRNVEEADTMNSLSMPERLRELRQREE